MREEYHQFEKIINIVKKPSETHKPPKADDFQVSKNVSQNTPKSPNITIKPQNITTSQQPVFKHNETHNNIKQMPFCPGFVWAFLSASATTLVNDMLFHSI